MTLNGNQTTTDSPTKGQRSLLWLPYVGIALLCLVFLAINFLCYHRKHRLRYQRKAEVLQTRERVMERRKLLNIIKARNSAKYGHEDNDVSSVNTCIVLSRIDGCDINTNGVAEL